MLLLSVLLADILIVNSFFSNTASVSRLQSCSSPNLRVESECLTALSMVPLGGLDVEVTSFPVPIEKWFPTGDDLSIPAPLNQLVDVNLERRSVVYEVTLGRVIGIEIIQGPLGPVVEQVITTSFYSYSYSTHLVFLFLLLFLILFLSYFIFILFVFFFLSFFSIFFTSSLRIR